MPGGWIELLDPIYPMDCDDDSFSHTALYRWSKLLNDAATKLGSSLDSGLGYRQQLIDGGFVNVQQRTFRWPLNEWPKDPKFKEVGKRLPSGN